jgi:D-alanyl-D-alanine carboxypeptidase
LSRGALRRILLLALAASAAGARSAPASPSETARLQAVADSLVRSSRIPGLTLAIARPGREVVSVAAGVADSVRRIPMPRDAIMHAGSVGKTFFAALALVMIGQGKLSLDEPVRIVMDDLPAWIHGLPNYESVTIGMLLNHTSGMGDLGAGFLRSMSDAPTIVRSPWDALRSVAGSAPVGAPGAAFHYSDANYLLLAGVLERRGGVKAYDAIQRRFVDPLQLTRTRPARSLRISGLVPGHAGADDPFAAHRRPAPETLLLDPTFEWGAGGFVSCSADLARWFAALGSGRVVPPAQWTLAMKGVPAPSLGPRATYGFGFRVDSTAAGVAIGHGGYFPGYVSWVRWYPDRQVAVAVQLNTSDDRRITVNIRDAMDRIAAREPSASAR